MFLGNVRRNFLMIKTEPLSPDPQAPGRCPPLALQDLRKGGVIGS